MEEMLRTHLIDLVDAYAAATDQSRATVGKLVLNDNTFFQRVASGANFTIKTYDRVVAWMEANWPAGAKWPSEVERAA